MDLNPFAEARFRHSVVLSFTVNYSSPNVLYFGSPQIISDILNITKLKQGDILVAIVET